MVRKKSIVELESDMLNGQKLQGPETAAEVNHLLASKGLEAEFPLFTAVHKVSHMQCSTQRLKNYIKVKLNSYLITLVRCARESWSPPS